ncbi:MAG: HEAT repeat domain-containing protein [Polyangia bacterium]
MSGYGLPMDLPRPEAAIRDVESKAAESRWLAALALAREDGDLRDEALRSLNHLARDSVAEVRAQALEGLAEQVRRGGCFAAETFRDALRDESGDVRCAAVEALDLFSDDFEGELVELLGDDEAAIRAIAARRLGEAGAARAADALAERLLDEDEVVRWEAALSLAALRDERACEALVSYLRSNAETAARAALALGEIGAPSCVPPLRETARRRFVGPELRAAAAVALSRCGTGEGNELLGRMLKAPGSRTRMAALGALARLPVRGIVAEAGALISARRSLEASLAIETVALLATCDRGPALDELRFRLDGLEGDLGSELREAIASVEKRAS